ncbi:MAG: hypothetical protein ACXAE3_00925 [Candidatus Kariarchaeaceae archaeon]
MIGYAHDTHQREFQVCTHVRRDDDADFCQIFTGVGIEYKIACFDCSSHYDERTDQFFEVSETEFNRIAENIENPFQWERAIGNPEILITDDLIFNRQEIPFDGLGVRNRIIQVCGDKSSSSVLVVVEDRLYSRLDFTSIRFVEIAQGSIQSILEITDNTISQISGMDFTKEVSLQYDSKAGLIVVANTYGEFAYVLTTSGELKLSTSRGKYQIKHSVFPLFLFEHNSVYYLIHGSDWNRLDISNIETGDIITARQVSDSFDYFHGKLLLSPNHTWLVSDGWVWAPVGMVTYWTLDRWFQDPGTPESRDVVYSLAGREEWGMGLCWYSDTKLLVVGYGTLDSIYHGVSLVDLENNQFHGWFPGPTGEISYHLESDLLISMESDSFSLWKLSTGTRRFHRENIRPLLLHQDCIYFTEDDQLFRFSLKVSPT